MQKLRETTDVQHVQRTYFQITTLGVLLHLSMTFIFFFLDCPLSSLYNGLSVLFYLCMLFFIHRQMFRLTVSCIHFEVCLFAVTNTLLCGWDLGLSLFLIALSSLVYFCPFAHKFIPYLFSVVEMLVFLALRIYTWNTVPFYPHISGSVMLLLHLYSAVACFCIVLFAAFSSNISALVMNRLLESENRSLTALANYDALTGLLGRRAFLTRVGQSRHSASVALALGDIDNFKSINDTYGHAAGDYVLCTVARLIDKSCGHQTQACRWGGEEFVFFFSHAADATSTLERLRTEIAEFPFSFQGHRFSITMTFGLCQDDVGQDIDALIAAADARMYFGKTSGKNQVVSEDADDTALSPQET